MASCVLLAVSWPGGACDGHTEVTSLPFRCLEAGHHCIPATRRDHKWQEQGQGQSLEEATKGSVGHDKASRSGKLVCEGTPRSRNRTWCVGRRGPSQQRCAALSVPFTVTMERGWSRTLLPTGQACLTCENIPEQRTHSFQVRTAFRRKAVLGHETAAN